MDRRDFIRNTAVITAAGIICPDAIASSDNQTKNIQGSVDGKLITSAPMLQNFAETSIGVAFSVSAMANGFVKVSEVDDMSNFRLIKCGGYRVTGMNADVMQIRVTGLKPSTRYYYTIGADRISYEGGYRMRIVSTEEDPKIYSFITSGPGTSSHFCVINDTHANFSTFQLLQEKITALNPSCVVWNGDATNCEESIDSQKEIFFYPPIKNSDYASEIPYLFCPGNHDSRGMANRSLEKIWMYRQPEERLSRDWDLGRNFAIRLGDIAMIGLDTAEDKLDENPIFAGLFSSSEYRKAQVKWLQHVLSLKNIKNAPFIVAFCHIPLFDSNPRHNPGDVYPNDTDSRYDTNFAEWQRTCSDLWMPVLEKAGCKLVITAHEHAVRIDGPTKERPWTQIVGGGPALGNPPTVIEGKVLNGQLQVSICNAANGDTMGQVTLKSK